MKKFPCWCCQGTGIVEEGERIDVGLGLSTVQVSADIDCGYCFGEGMIEVNGPVHTQIKKRNLSFKVWEQFCPREMTEAEARFTQERIDKLVDQLVEVFKE